MNPYKPEFIIEISTKRSEVVQRLEELKNKLLTEFLENLKDAKAREYVINGLCRRIVLLKWCVNKVFSVFPLTQTDKLSENHRLEVVSALHTFAINMAGAFDNIAWMFVYELDLVDVIGSKNFVGLYCGKTQKYLPQGVLNYLNTKHMKEWNNSYSKNYRDALAHRIPLYVPPSELSVTESLRKAELEAKLCGTKLSVDEEAGIQKELDGIGSVCFSFMHSFSSDEMAPPVGFHAQLVADANTLIHLIETVINCGV